MLNSHNLLLTQASYVSKWQSLPPAVKIWESFVFPDSSHPVHHPSSRPLRVPRHLRPSSVTTDGTHPACPLLLADWPPFCLSNTRLLSGECTWSLWSALPVDICVTAASASHCADLGSPYPSLPERGLSHLLYLKETLPHRSGFPVPFSGFPVPFSLLAFITPKLNFLLTCWFICLSLALWAS